MVVFKCVFMYKRLQKWYMNGSETDEKCSSLVTWEMQIETTVSYHFYPT